MYDKSETAAEGLIEPLTKAHNSTLGSCLAQTNLELSRIKL